MTVKDWSQTAYKEISNGKDWSFEVTFYLDLNGKDCTCKGIFDDGNGEMETKCPEKIEIHELNC